MPSPINTGPLLWHRYDSLAQQPEVGSHAFYGSPTFGTGRWGGACEINSLTEYGETVIPAAQVGQGRSLTVVWYQRTAWRLNGNAVTPLSGYYGGYYGMLTFGAASYSPRVAVGAFYDWSYALGVETGGLSPNLYAYGNATTNSDTWYQWALVVDESAATKVRLMIDGVTVVSSTSVWGPMSGDIYFRFGKRYWSSSDHQAVDGLVDNVMVFGYPLTAEQLAYLREHEDWRGTARRRVLRPLAIL